MKWSEDEFFMKARDSGWKIKRSGAFRDSPCMHSIRRYLAERDIPMTIENKDKNSLATFAGRTRTQVDHVRGSGSQAMFAGHVRRLGMHVGTFASHIRTLAGHVGGPGS